MSSVIRASLGSEVSSTLLGGSWVVISGVINPFIWLVTTVILLTNLLIAHHEPPSTTHSRMVPERKHIPETRRAARVQNHIQ